MRKHPNRIRRTGEDWAVDTVVYIVLAVVFFVTAYPFYYGLIISLNDAADSAIGGIYFWPRIWTLESYKSFFVDSTWLMGLGVSVARTLIGTSITVMFTMLVSYGLSDRKLVFRKFYMALIIFSMYFSGGLIPYYMLLKFLGMLDRFVVYVIPPALSAFFIFIAISFYDGIPGELRESAMLDGASEMRVFRSIILPVSLPLLATIAIFAGVGQWNAWFDSAFFVKSKSLRTMGYLMMETINQANVPTNAISAMQSTGGSKVNPFSIRVTAMMISVIPILCIYPFLQRYFVAGLTIGAVKG